MYKHPGLSGDEASLHSGQFKRGLGPELSFSGPGELPIACTGLWAHCAMAVMIGELSEVSAQITQNWLTIMMGISAGILIIVKKRIPQGF